jgi:hypothetical protein
MTPVETLTAAQRKHCDRLLRLPHVVSVGVGYRYVHGSRTRDLCLVVGVDHKVSARGLAKRDLVPRRLGPILTDVQELGEVRVPPPLEIDPTEPIRPAPPGVSIGHHSITAGTFGCVVARGSHNYILSNNHVLAATNLGTAGDAILQPGPYDGGTIFSSTIASLTEFVPIAFPDTDPPPGCGVSRAIAATLNLLARALGRQSRLQAVVPRAAINLMDAAIADPISQDSILEAILNIGRPTGIAEAVPGLAVQKYGRTTRHTLGEVLQVGTTIRVNYGERGIATFQDQLVTTPMSQGGDSGSSVLTVGGEIVGLLFAGSDASTIVSPIGPIFDALRVTLPAATQKMEVEEPEEPTDEPE